MTTADRTGEGDLVRVDVEKVTGGAGNDSLFGSDGSDTFHAQDGQADTCNGGNDSDIAADYDSGLDTLVSVP